MHRDSTPRAARLEAVASLERMPEEDDAVDLRDDRIHDRAGLDGTVAVVTGGASGIGAACCRLLEASGATVHVADREGDQSVDVNDRTALDALAARLDRLNVLINAAGILTENKPVDDLPADDFRRNYEVNVIGTLNACQAFAPLLKASAGSVVNVASQAALVSLPSQAAYTASKGAVAALTRSLAIDWAEHGIRVNAVAPGFTVDPDDRSVLRERDLHAGRDQAYPARQASRGRRDRECDRLPGEPAGERDHGRGPARRRRMDGRRTCPTLVIWWRRFADPLGDVRGKRPYAVALSLPTHMRLREWWIEGPRRGAPRCLRALADGLRRGHRVDGRCGASDGGVRAMTHVRAVPTGDRDVELRVAPHAVLGHVEAQLLDLGLGADPERRP